MVFSFTVLSATLVEIRGLGQNFKDNFGDFYDDKFHHFAITKKDNSVRYFIDGNLIKLFAFKSKRANNTLCIGGRYDNNKGLPCCPMYMSEFRISKVCRYTDNFTPQETPFILD